jgi:hypothetical protein
LVTLTGGAKETNDRQSAKAGNKKMFFIKYGLK